MPPPHIADSVMFSAAGAWERDEAGTIAAIGSEGGTLDADCAASPPATDQHRPTQTSDVESTPLDVF